MRSEGQWLRTVRDFPPVLSALTFVYRLFHTIGLPLNERIYQHLPYHGVVTVPCGIGRSFFISCDGRALENGLFWIGLQGFEPESMRIWLEHAATAKCVLDIGANSGVYSLAAAALGVANVHAFEPIDRIREILLHNVRLNSFSNAAVWEYCVSDHDGHIEIYDPGGDVPSSATASPEFARQHLAAFPVQKRDAVTISVDQFCIQQRIPKVDLVKIDVEGFELQVLAGMRNTLTNSRPVVLVEVLDPVNPVMLGFLEELRGMGYSIERVCERNNHPDRNLLLTP